MQRQGHTSRAQTWEALPLLSTCELCIAVPPAPRLLRTSSPAVRFCVWPLPAKPEPACLFLATSHEVCTARWPSCSLPNAAATLEPHSMPLTWWLCGPPCSEGKTAKSILASKSYSLPSGSPLARRSAGLAPWGERGGRGGVRKSVREVVGRQMRHSAGGLGPGGLLGDSQGAGAGLEGSSSQPS